MAVSVYTGRYEVVSKANSPSRGGVNTPAQTRLACSGHA